jgi:hypothetical protein
MRERVAPGIATAIAYLILAARAWAATHATAYTQVEVRNVGSGTGTVTVPVETDYIPNVVQAENGNASLEALKAQAVAARSYMYYKLNNQGWISDGTEDQVYTPAGQSGPGGSAPTANQLLAASSTEREILRYNNTQVCAFYVAGQRPSTSGTAPFGVAEAGDSGNTATEPYVTYNRGQTGTGANFEQTTLGFVSPTNYANRGCKSQNGADFLSDNGWNYVDILRFYYGADIRLEVAKVPGSGEAPAVKTVAGFDVDQGYFGNGAVSANNVNITSATRSRVTTGTHSGAGAQQIAVDYNNGAGGFTHFNLAGLGPNSVQKLDGTTPGDGVVATEPSNLAMESVGSIGFWLKAGILAGNPNLTASILLDDEGDGTEVSQALVVPADGQWHKYEWYLDRNTDWYNFSGGNGAINGSYFSIDSIRLTGLSDATFTLDDVLYDAAAVPEPSAALSLVTIACVISARRVRKA